jgi:predicted O-methyltransferase YrrM
MAVPAGPPLCSLDDPRVRRVLERLFVEKRGQRLRMAGHVASFIADSVVRRQSSLAREVEGLKNLHASVSPKQGRFLYSVARAIRARRIVEYGTSVGVSAVHLAAAVRDNGGGIVIGSEIDPRKVEAARRNVAEAGLADFTEVREGDALETLVDAGGVIDMVFLDGFPRLYLPLLRLLLPQLRSGAVLMADNIFTHRKIVAPFRVFLREPANGFVTTTLLLRYGVEYAVRL